MFQEQIGQIPGVRITTIEGVDERGRPVVLGADGNPCSAAVMWSAQHPTWSECVGLRVAVAPVDTSDFEAELLVIGLLDAAPSVSTTPPEVLRFEGRREVVIECGKAKIAMRADGRIEIRGGHLISRSSGPNKIKGGSVHIN